MVSAVTFPQAFANLGTPRFFHRGSFLFRQGALDGNLFFIKSGLAKAYYDTLDGKEFIKSFIAEGAFIASMQAIVAGMPNTFSVLALEDCEVLEVPKQRLLEQMATNLAIKDLLNSLLLTLAMKKEQREYDLLCMTPRQRYRAFCEREATLLKRLSQQDIARYLGITPVGLSRIRKSSKKVGE